MITLQDVISEVVANNVEMKAEFFVTQFSGKILENSELVKLSSQCWFQLKFLIGILLIIIMFVEFSFEFFYDQLRTQNIELRILLKTQDIGLNIDLLQFWISESLAFMQEIYSKVLLTVMSSVGS